ncbi:MAG: M24 family metallopeptidase, partial [Rikenellaceae bacterium]
GRSSDLLMELLGCQREVDLQGYISPKLALVVSALREIKDSDEIAELEEACRVGCMMHQRAMRLTIAGLSEHAVAGEVDGIARSEGQGVSFSTIYTQHGEILHGSPRRDLLRDGAMVLCDAGAESHSGYCSDHTRTYPVSGKFSDVQRDIYNIVLDVHNFVAQSIKPNIYYRDLQNMTLRMLADRLKEFGLLRGSLDEIMESGAVKLFMPHGVGHGLGMDVHDCEALGGRYLDFEGYEQEIEHYGSSIFREWWTLREGGVMTNEPGVYFIGALIEKSLGEGFYRGIVNYNMALSMRDFGGVRIEDDYLVTAQGCRPIKSHLHIPKSVAEIEEYMRSCR